MAHATAWFRGETSGMTLQEIYKKNRFRRFPQTSFTFALDSLIHASASCKLPATKMSTALPKTMRAARLMKVRRKRPHHKTPNTNYDRTRSSVSAMNCKKFQSRNSAITTCSSRLAQQASAIQTTKYGRAHISLHCQSRPPTSPLALLLPSEKRQPRETGESASASAY